MKALAVALAALAVWLRWEWKRAPLVDERGRRV